MHNIFILTYNKKKNNSFLLFNFAFLIIVFALRLQGPEDPILLAFCVPWLCSAWLIYLTSVSSLLGPTQVGRSVLGLLFIPFPFWAPFPYSYGLQVSTHYVCRSEYTRSVYPFPLSLPYPPMGATEGTKELLIPLIPPLFLPSGGKGR